MGLWSSEAPLRALGVGVSFVTFLYFVPRSGFRVRSLRSA